MEFLLHIYANWYEAEYVVGPQDSKDTLRKTCLACAILSSCKKWVSLRLELSSYQIIFEKKIHKLITQYSKKCLEIGM